MRLLQLSLLLFMMIGSTTAIRMVAAPRLNNSESLTVVARDGAVLLTWNSTTHHLGALRDWPLVAMGTVRLPARLLALRLDKDSRVVPHIESLSSIPWRGAPSVFSAPTAGIRAPDGAQPQISDLPGSPIIPLRTAWLRGIQIAVVAFSPLFISDGRWQMVTNLQVRFPTTSLLSDEAAWLQKGSAPFLADVPPPPNADTGTRWAIRVTTPGIQVLSGDMLTSAGVDTGNLSGLHVRHNGVEIPLDVRDGGDGSLDLSDELRFYASTPGDRWNDIDIYWLTIEPTPGLRMTTRTVTPAGAPLRTIGIERGVWQPNLRYDSMLPGVDGDHWYAADLRTGPGEPSMALSVPLSATLPLATGQLTLTITGSAYTPDDHHLEVTVGSTLQTISWSGDGAWTRTFSFGENGSAAVLRLLPGEDPAGFLPDSVAWERPVVLNLGGRGAIFSGATGNWQYQISDSHEGALVYDISDPLKPSMLAIPEGLRFQDGPQAHTYLVTGQGTVFTPTISVALPNDLDSPRNADVVYIAPASLHAGLAPLVERRQSQGYRVALIDVQAIYDAWSFGRVSPDAIREFLRYAASTWPVAPRFVTLVGDGTSDPRNYSGRNNATLVPPYLAMVDPWLGETACDACYAQLDGASPLDDPLSDVYIGRLPVKSAAELQTLVTKIIGYETGRLDPQVQMRVLYVADNYRDAAGNPDSAGDFASAADASAALAPASVDIERVYYDPWKRDQNGQPLLDPWRETDAARVYQRTLAALNDGAGLVNYIGHSHNWQWAVTDPAVTPGYMLGLYDPDKLTNSGRLSIVIELTCLTAAFQTPAFSGTTIDERLLLAPNGAVAVWGSTGLGVTYGHDALQHGFYHMLWSSAPETASLGALTQAGYLELFTNSGCCQDTLRTYVLLGDPLTPARVRADWRLSLPLMQR